LPATFACSELFDSATMSLLGTNAQCSATASQTNQSSVRIHLLPESTVSINSTLVVKSGQTVLRDFLEPSALFLANNLTISKCNPCAMSSPTVSMLAPEVCFVRINGMLCIL
jgi:hypothetical protein